ncbi:MAG: phosphate ABC transporter permease PstA [Planctomycetota bacterium]
MTNETEDPRHVAAAPQAGGEGTSPAASSIDAAQFTATRLDQKNARTELCYHSLFLLMSIVLILPVLAILSLLIIKGAPAFSWEFFTEPPRAQYTEGGIFPALVGTLWLVIVALLASVPLGVAAAIYLSEYAKDNALTRLINLAIINLAGVPSIVHALFGLGAFVLFFDFGTSILAASLTLAIMTLPVVIVSTRETLQAVPQSFRMACWSLGATRWQTIRKVVLPNSISGILTGVILEVSRTVGETAPVMFTGAVLFTPYLPQGVLDETMAMSLHLYMIATIIPDVPPEVPYGVALSLILMVLILNAASIGFRVYLRGKKKW